MTEINTPEAEDVALPVLPLSSGVVLPQMVVTLTLESERPGTRPWRPVEAADGRVLLVPRVDGGYAGSGPSPGSRTTASCRTGSRALVLRGLARATVGAGVATDEPGLWVEAELVTDRGRGDRAGQGPGARVPRGRARDRRAAPVAAVCRRARRRRRPGARWRTPPAGRPTSRWSSKVELLETLDAEARLERALGVGAGRARRARARGADPPRGQRRHGQDAARVPAASAARRDPQGAG